MKEFGFYSGCRGKPLEGFDLKLTCYTLLKDNSGCCLVGESVVVSGSWETVVQKKDGGWAWGASH